MIDGARRRTAVAIGLGWSLAAVLPVAAQPGSDELIPIRIDELHLLYEAMVAYQVDARRYIAADLPDQTTHDLVFAERLGLAAKGSVVHPRFWSWEARANVVLYERLRKEPEKDCTDGIFKPDVEYDVGFHFLEEHPLSLHLNANRRSVLAQNTFARHHTIQSSTVGGTVNWLNEVAPIQVGLTHTRNRFGLGAPELGDNQVTNLFAAAHHDHESQTADLEYRLFRFANDDYPDLDYLWHRGAFQYYLFPLLDRYGRRYQLHSRADLLSSQSTYDRLDIRAVQEAILMWRPHFRTIARYSFQQWRSMTPASQHSLSLRTRYDLWESMTLALIPEGLVIRREDQTLWTGRLGAEALYQKKIANVVRMTHTYRFVGELYQGEFTFGDQQVVNEPLILDGYRSLALTQPRVRAGTVTVVDAETWLPYQEGLDFQTFVAGERTYLERIPGSSIPDGGSVLVSYEYEPDDLTQLRTTDHWYGARLDTIFSPYVRFSVELSERWRRSTDADCRCRMERYEIFGAQAQADYKFIHARVGARWFRTLGVRHQDFHATVAGRFDLGSFHPSVGVRVGIQHFNDTDQIRQHYEVFAQGTLNTPIGIFMDWNVRFLHEELDPWSADYFDASWRVNWRVRSLRLSLEYRVLGRVNESEQYDNHRVFFSVGRMM